MKVIKGGEFLIKQVEKEDVFITEQFSEEQQMMKDAVVEFIDREVWPIKERFTCNLLSANSKTMSHIGCRLCSSGACIINNNHLNLK